jgi:hypothetical protein
VGRVMTPPARSASPLRQPAPPARSANPLRQPAPPTRSANPLRQPTPPTHSANPLRQPTPPTHSANSLRQPADYLNRPRDPAALKSNCVYRSRKESPTPPSCSAMLDGRPLDPNPIADCDRRTDPTSWQLPVGPLWSPSDPTAGQSINNSVLFFILRHSCWSPAR